MRNELYIVESNQTIYDVGLQKYGSIDGVFLLLTDNPQLPGLDTILIAGQKLKIKSDPIDGDVVNYYTKNAIVPATEVTDIDEFEIITDGDFDLDDFDENDFL